MTIERPPVGIPITHYIERRGHRFRARVRWMNPTTKKRDSLSETFSDEMGAQAWVAQMERYGQAGVSPQQASLTLADYGDSILPLALRGLEPKTVDIYSMCWRLRVKPALGHISVPMVTNGAVDRIVHGWIADELSRSMVKNSLAVLVRVMEQAVRDGIRDRNPARITGWQKEYQKFEDELDDPRTLALPSWDSLTELSDALVARSVDQFRGWGDAVTFMACTASRIGETSGVRVSDIDVNTWHWTVRRQTTTSPGGLMDKGTKGKRARLVPIIEEVQPMVLRRIEKAKDRESRLFTGPRGGRISTAVLRDATHWDEVVTKLGYPHLRRHDLRHTGLTWMADAGVPLHVLRKIAGHGSITTTQRYLHPDRRSVTEAGNSLSAHLTPARPQNGPSAEAV